MRAGRQLHTRRSLLRVPETRVSSDAAPFSGHTQWTNIFTEVIASSKFGLHTVCRTPDPKSKLQKMGH